MKEKLVKNKTLCVYNERGVGLMLSGIFYCSIVNLFHLIEFATQTPGVAELLESAAPNPPVELPLASPK